MIKKIFKIIAILFILLYLLLTLLWYFFFPINYITKYYIINNNSEDIFLSIVTYDNQNYKQILTEWEKYEFENNIIIWDNPELSGIKSFNILINDNIIFNSEDYLLNNSKINDNIDIIETTQVKEKIYYFPVYNKKEFIYFYKNITIK